jgi:glycosyltransferase involved in cell wall biosynthesis
MITYRHEAFIKQAIEGVLNQHCSFSVELIIANDNSPDNTDYVISKLLNCFSDKHTVKYTRHERNKGVMPNFLWAISQAQGKFIALCEGDDYWTDPFKLQKQVDFLEQHQNYSFSYHDSTVEKEGKNISNSLLEGKGKTLNRFDIVKTPVIPTQTVVFRNNLIKSFPKSFLKITNGDSFLFSLLAQFGDAHFHKDIKNSVYRIHGGGIWTKESLFNKYKQSLQSLTAIKQALPEKFKPHVAERINAMFFQAYHLFLEKQDKDSALAICKLYRGYYIRTFQPGKAWLVSTYGRRLKKA